MLICDRLRGLNYLMLVSTSYVWNSLSSLSRRMVAMGIISEMRVAIEQLENLQKRLELEISVEDADIDFDLWFSDDFTNQIQPLFQGSCYAESEEDSGMVNNMCDLFPFGKSVTFSDTTASSIKTGMRQLISERVVNHADIGYALKAGYGKIVTLLLQIKERMTNIPDELYENYCKDSFSRDLDLAFQQAERNYQQWKDEHDWKSQQALEDKRTQEIVELLRSDVFSYSTKPTNREIKECILKIQEDALEHDTQLPENIETESARFAHFVVMKDCIMCLDYAKLGKYLYKHFQKISFKQELKLKVFDVTLNFIQRDMAALNPKLSVLLPDYEDNKLQAVLDNALRVITSCNSYLSEKLPNDFLEQYLKAAFYGEIKHEVQTSLGRKGIYTKICKLLGMLKASMKVFKVGTSSEQLAACVSKLTDKPNKDSMIRKIDEGASDMNSKIRIWTEDYIKTHCCTESERLFLEQAKS